MLMTFLGLHAQTFRLELTTSMFNHTLTSHLWTPFSPELSFLTWLVWTWIDSPCIETSEVSQVSQPTSDSFQVLLPALVHVWEPHQLKQFWKPDDAFWWASPLEEAANFVLSRKLWHQLCPRLCLQWWENANHFPFDLSCPQFRPNLPTGSFSLFQARITPWNLANMWGFEHACRNVKLKSDNQETDVSFLGILKFHQEQSTPKNFPIAIHHQEPLCSCGCLKMIEGVQLIQPHWFHALSHMSLMTNDQAKACNTAAILSSSKKLFSKKAKKNLATNFNPCKHTCLCWPSRHSQQMKHSDCIEEAQKMMVNKMCFDLKGIGCEGVWPKTNQKPTLAKKWKLSIKKSALHVSSHKHDVHVTKRWLNQCQLQKHLCECSFVTEIESGFETAHTWIVAGAALDVWCKICAWCKCDEHDWEHYPCGENVASLSQNLKHVTDITHCSLHQNQDKNIGKKHCNLRNMWPHQALDGEKNNQIVAHNGTMLALGG